jgi:hypothetical protein
MGARSDLDPVSARTNGSCGTVRNSSFVGLRFIPRPEAIQDRQLPGFIEVQEEFREEFHRFRHTEAKQLEYQQLLAERESLQAEDTILQSSGIKLSDIRNQLTTIETAIGSHQSSFKEHNSKLQALSEHVESMKVGQQYVERFFCSFLRSYRLNAVVLHLQTVIESFEEGDLSGDSENLSDIRQDLRQIQVQIMEAKEDTQNTQQDLNSTKIVRR